MADLAATIAAAGQSGGTQMRIGVVRAFDATTGTLTVTIGGPTPEQLAADLQSPNPKYGGLQPGTDMPGAFYNPAYLPLVGDAVAVLNYGPTWYVMGSTSNTLARSLPVGGIVQTAEVCTSLTFGDLATVGPSATVMVGASGRVMVDVSAQLAATTGNGAVIGCALTGANVAAADSARAWNQVNEVAAVTTNPSVTRRLLYTGLTQGLTTFTMKYAVIGTSSTSVSVRNREITAQAY